MYKHTRVLQEYEEGVTPEAIAVKDLDKFDMIFQAFEYETGKIMCVCFIFFCRHLYFTIKMYALLHGKSESSI